jgi:hypothetical protein
MEVWLPEGLNSAKGPRSLQNAMGVRALAFGGELAVQGFYDDELSPTSLLRPAG